MFIVLYKYIYNLNFIYLFIVIFINIEHILLFIIKVYDFYQGF